MAWNDVPSSMIRYKAIISYDGTEFAGFQRQKKARTVQGELEAALRELGWQKNAILAAGRTDQGVHASGQVVVFVPVFQVREQVLDHAEPGELLVVGAYHCPRRHRAMRAREHVVARCAVIAPVLLRHGVDRAHLPLLERIAAARGQTLLLFGLADVG